MARRIEGELLQPLRAADQQQQLRWSLPANLHITLAYMGALNADRLDKVQQCASALAIAPFSLELGSLIHFPDAKSRILAIDVALNEPLRQLHDILNQTLLAANVDCDQRSYRPHITLGRIKHRQQILDWQLPQYQGRLWVDRFVLYASESSVGRKAIVPPGTKESSSYRIISEFPLIG